MTDGSDATGGGRDAVPGTMDTTSGSDDRESRALRDPLMRFDLSAEIDRLTSEHKWNDDGKNSIVLAKDARLRVLLTVLRSGARVGDDDADGPITVQVLGGRVTAEHEGRSETLGDGELATIEAGGAWSVEAADDSAILLTIAWPPEKAGV
jgi:quercetin dioxygenase-like cupin family protein